MTAPRQVQRLLARMAAAGWTIWRPGEWQRLQAARREELNDATTSGAIRGAITVLLLWILYTLID